MSSLTKGRKVDLINLALELNETVPPDSELIDLRNVITGSEYYEEGFVKYLFNRVIEERVEKEKEKKVRERENANTKWEREKEKAEAQEGTEKRIKLNLN
ncbi:hypothetical protein TNCV_430911 [Trichonephila clavipes]|nr:hypothetical protein TNCV_430911 [Trichonephila clavipes]